MSGSRPDPNAVTRRSPGARLLLVLAGFVALDCMLVASGIGDTQQRAVALDAAIGGFVLGHAVSPAWSFHGFDRRGVRDCESELFPIVGAPCCDPGHRASLAPRSARTDGERP